MVLLIGSCNIHHNTQINTGAVFIMSRINYFMDRQTNNMTTDTTFRAAGSRLWNSLPSDVIDCQTVDTFRRRLKHFFFNVSFS